MTSVRWSCLPILLSIISPISQAVGQASGGGPHKTYNLQEFDPGCGKAGHNCQRAFQFAFRTLGREGGGILQLAAGTFQIDFPGVAQNIMGATLPPQSLLVVPANTIIEGHVAADGTPDSVIEWHITSIPVFVFAKANHSGMRNLHARFTGSMPRVYPFGDIALLKAIGYHPTFPHLDQMSGSNGEMFSFAMVFDSDGCTFDHLLFDSATRDKDHVFAMAINLKGKGVIETDGGGMNTLADSNHITNIEVYDFLNAFLVSGQSNFVLQTVTADRRGSVVNTAPGHVIYTNLMNEFDAGGKVVNARLSTNCRIENVTEGPHTYSNEVAGGTLAIKGLNGAEVSNVNSQHPEGLIQTIYADQNVLFRNLTWKSDYDLCGNVPGNCVTPVIHSMPSPPNLPPSKNLTFENIRLVSTVTPITVGLIGDNLRVNGIEITTPAEFLPGQKATNAVLSVRNSDGAVIRGYTYTPIVNRYDPTAKHNMPFTGWNSTKNASAEVIIKWPSQIPVPGTKEAIVAPGYQDRSPEANNSLRSSVVRR